MTCRLAMTWILKPLHLLLAASLLWAALPLDVARAQNGGPVYIVQPGDTLFAIARQFGVPLEGLQAANPTVNANALQVGQALVIPGYGDFSGTLSTHLLEPGESLESLSLRFGLRRETLIRLNRILNPDQLYIHQPVVLVDQTDGGAPLETGEIAWLRPGQSPLALAASRNQNVWTLAALSRKAPMELALPGAPAVLAAGERPIKALPSPLRDLRLQPLPIEQGHTLALQVVASEPVQLSGALGEWPLNFVSDPAQPNTYYALQGIYRLAEPNLYSLAIEVVDAAGEGARFTQALPVRAGSYATDPQLTVDPSTLDPASIQAEIDRIKAVVTVPTPDRYWNGLFALPSVGAIRSRYGSLRAYNGGPYDSYHGGVDFSGGEDRPITAPAPGVVALIDTFPVRGQATIIDHGWGVFTLYGHQSRVEVEVGQRVETGQVIGYQGATGRVTGPHLHWEVWVGGFPVEPLQWIEVAFP